MEGGRSDDDDDYNDDEGGVGDAGALYTHTHTHIKSDLFTTKNNISCCMCNNVEGERTHTHIKFIERTYSWQRHIKKDICCIPTTLARS